MRHNSTPPQIVTYQRMYCGLMILFAAGFLTKATKGWWVFNMVLIVLGMTSLCCLPVTIPLLIGWLKPETKAWFGYGEAVPDVF